MIRKEAVVENTAGFHVRSATLVCKAAMKYESSIKLAKGSAEADCKSALDLLSLMAPQGEKLTLIAEGPDEEQASNEILTLFKMKFYEDEFAPEDQKD